MWLRAPLPRTLEAALRDLDERDPKVRFSAVGDLLAYVDSPARAEVIAAATRMLCDSSRDVRARAATVLGEAKATSAIAALEAAARDDDEVVRQMAIDALASLGDPRSAATVRRALSDPRPEMRFQAVIALPRVDPEGAPAELARAAGDRDAKVRYIALRIAEELVHGHGGFATRTDATLPDGLRDVARSALEDEDADVRIAAALLLGASGDRAGKDVLLAVAAGRLRASEPEDEAAALEMTGELGLRDAEAALATRAWGASRLLRDRMSFHAKIALARMGNERAARELVKELDAWTIARRNVAVMAVGRARITAARPKLVAMRARPERADAELVQEALDALDLGVTR